MRIPIYVTALVAGVLLAMGGYSRVRMEEARNERERVNAEARAEDWRFVSGGDVVRAGSRSRSGQRGNVGEAAAAVIAYARGLPFPDDFPEAERLRRVREESERIQRMNGDELRAMIGELRGADDIVRKVRGDLMMFVLQVYGESYVREALDVVVELDDPSEIQVDQRVLYENLVEAWARVDPTSGWAWMEELPEETEKRWGDTIERALICGALVGDPVQALEWSAAKGHGVGGALAGGELSGEERLAFLRAMRIWESRSGNGPWPGEDRGTCLKEVIFGKEKGRILSLAAVNAQWEAARVQEDEVRSLGVVDVGEMIDPAEEDEWAVWLAERLTGEANVRVEDGKVATPVPGRPGFVFSPYTNKEVDIGMMHPGTLVRDPTVPGNAVFRVP